MKGLKVRISPNAAIRCCLLCVVFLGSSALAHEERTPVIVDTDMGMDDVRALALMLSSPHLDVKAIVTADGASSPEAGVRNLRCILSFLGRAGIPVAAGAPLAAPAPPWREMSEALGWAKLSSSREGQRGCAAANEATTLPQRPAGRGQAAGSAAASLIVKTVAESDQRVSYIGIGPLTNLAEALRMDPSVSSRISIIFYYGTPPDELKSDWNTSRDIAAARAVFAAGVPLNALALPDEEPLTFDSALLDEIRRLDSPASRLISLLYEDDRVKTLLLQNHFKAWDETVALYLEDPGIATFEKVHAASPLFRLSKLDRDAARADYIEILSRSDKLQLEPRMPVVLEAYPTDPALFQKDLRPFIPRIIALHGIEEWKAAVLTNELHRHLGIYSILGAKMGILAREILNAPLDELTVESHAGLKPPFSCLNDGLQAATGASLGRGTITVPETHSPAVEAVFTRGDRKLRLRVKDSVKDRIASDIQHAIQRYGDVTPEYFKEVRRLSFEYWAEMKRGEIFEQELIAPTPRNP
jgi:pyrimidine-specific ribonucleoside hydrolase